MLLTDKERLELEGLKAKQESRSFPLMQYQYDRLIFLRKKELLYCCSNPNCTGYSGTEAETVCPKCGANLIV